MNPGPYMDARVAVAVLGWKLEEHDFGHDMPGGPFHAVAYNGEAHVLEIPRFSEDIAAAWMVVERLVALGFSYCIEKMWSVEKPTVHFVAEHELPLSPLKTLHYIEDAERRSFASGALPEAICRAALKAVGVEV